MAANRRSILTNGSAYNDGSSHSFHESSNDLPSTFFVRALYDYQSADSSSLSFRKGAMIEVLTQLDSGWWDGLLDEERGWFPSNYVEPVPEHELEQEFQARLPPQPAAQDSQRVPTPRAPHVPNDSQTWQHNNALHTSMATQSTAVASSSNLPRTASSQATDYWEPRMTQTGQIYYINLETGEQSSELPAMPSDADEAWNEALYDSYGDVSGHNRVDSRSIPPAGRPLSNMYAAGFGLPRRTGTPEPWVKRITDDGMAYFYINSITNETRWTPPSPLRPSAPLPGNGSEVRSQSTLYGTDYASQVQNISRSMTQLSVYSDASEVNALGERPPTAPSAFSNQSTQSISSGTRRNRAIRRLPDAPLTGPRKATEHATELQRLLAPEEAQRLEAYSIRAREAIEIVIDTATEVLDESPTFPQDGIDFLRERRIAGLTEEDTGSHPRLSGRVAQAVTAILSLLLVSGKLVPPMLESDVSSLSATQEYVKNTAADPLTSFHRKVSATLSKLVLSARAADAVPDSRPTDMAVSIERDAQELERAVITFVMEVQRAGAAARPRRMKGVLSPGHGMAGVGTGIMGGGFGAGWKGNGFVPLPADSRAMQPLETDVIKELNHLSIALDEDLTTLAEFVGIGYSRLYQSRAGSPTDPFMDMGEPIVSDNVSRGIPPDVAAQVTQQSRAVIAHLAAFLGLAENVDIASQVDFDGGVSDVYGLSRSDMPDEYDSNVRRARILMRTLEMTKQALYDQGAVLLMASQAAPLAALSSSVEAADQSPSHIVLTSVAGLKSSVNELMETFESLLDVATSQSDAVKSGHRGTIGLRSPGYRASPVDIFGPSMTDSYILTQNDMSYTSMLNQADGDLEVGLADALNPYGFSGLDHTYDPAAMFQAGDPAQPQADFEYDGDHIPGSGINGHEPSGPSATAIDEPEGNERRSADMDDAWNSAAEFTDDESPRFDEFGRPRHTARTKTKVEKLKTFFGEDAPEHIIAAQAAETQPSYMKPMYGPPDIIVNPDGGVRGGTLPALIEHLTMHDGLDSTFNETFLMTFKSFAPLDEIVTELIARFNLPQPPDLTSAQVKDWRARKQQFIRFRTMNILKALIQSQALEQDDLKILERIKTFAESIKEADMFAPSRQLIQSIKMRTDDAAAKKYKPNGLQFPPQPILPKTSKKIRLPDVDSLELARQLTIIESRLYNKVRPTECLARGKSRPTAESTQDNIKSIITMSNHLAVWVADSVLAKEEPKKRAIVLRYFIQTAEHCKRLKNFSTMSGLIAGLNSPPIRRLRRTWELVNPKSVATMADLESTIDAGKNFTAYRKMLDSIDPPCVPFFGIYLTYLTFIQDGNPNFIKVGDAQVINFDKRQKAAQIIREIQRYQSATYDLSPVTSIIEFIEQSMAASALKESEFWNLSLELEPREREEEKMARLLQESGFL